jgi:hypothetical protein
MTRKSFIRSLVLAAMMAAFAALAPSMHAQTTLPCNGCDHITIANETNCKITLCFENIELVFCQDFTAMSKTKIPCGGITKISIRDCFGNLHPVTRDCVNLGVTGGCCVRACLELDAAGCVVVHITPSPINCLCG